MLRHGGLESLPGLRARKESAVSSPGDPGTRGLTDIKVDFEPDATFTVASAIDGERRQNWIEQFGAAHNAIAECLGSNEAAKSFVDRVLDYDDREDTFTTCSLYFVEGVVP